MTTFNWQVAQLDRLTSDGFVTTAHYIVNATDGAYSASTYGTVGFEQNPEAEDFTPYADLTQEQVVGWVQAKLGKDIVEDSLQSQIDAQKAPVQESGVPWAMQTQGA